jgi:hypothetical protein
MCKFLMTCNTLIIRPLSFISHAAFLILLSTICRTQGSTFHRLSSVEPALTQEPSWEEYTPSEAPYLPMLLACCYIPRILLDAAGVLILSVNRLASIMEIIVTCDHFVQAH